MHFATGCCAYERVCARRLIGNFSIKWEIGYNAIWATVLFDHLKLPMPLHLFITPFLYKLIGRNRHSFRNLFYSTRIQRNHTKRTYNAARVLIVYARALRKWEYDRTMNTINCTPISISGSPLSDGARATDTDTDFCALFTFAGLNHLHNLICSSQICDCVCVRASERAAARFNCVVRPAIMQYRRIFDIPLWICSSTIESNSCVCVFVFIL